MEEPIEQCGDGGGVAEQLEDECPQQDLAELRVGLHKIEPLFAVELDDLT
jgi:hypothetical protein